MLTVVVYVLLCIIWGTTWSAIQIGLRGIPPLSGVAIRFFLAGLLLWVIARVRGIQLGKKKHEKRLWWINTVLAFAVSYGVVYWAEQWVPSGLASILFATYVLFLGLFGWFGLPGERASLGEGLGMVLGFAGVAVIFSSDFAQLGGSRTLLAAVVFLVSPAAAALATVCVKRWGREIHPVSLTAVPMLLTGVVMGAAAVLFERGHTYVFDLPSVTALLYLTVFGTAVTFTLYYWLLAYLPAKRMGLITYLIPLIAVAIGTLRGETLTTRIVIGSVMVLLGVVLAIHFQTRTKRAAMARESTAGNDAHQVAADPRPVGAQRVSENREQDADRG